MSNNTQRYEVVAPMPHFTHLMAGDILVPKYHALAGDCWGHDEETNPLRWVTFCPDYPHLFRPLKWWDMLDANEYPKYIKVEYLSGEEIYKVKEYRDLGANKYAFYEYLNVSDLVDLNSCEPATEAEYNEYLTKLNGK
jgi:hypothetical protein